MYTRVLGLTTLALILAYGAAGAIAQDRMTPQPDQQQMQSHPTSREGAGTMGHMMGGGTEGGMMDRGMMGRGMMGGAMMDHGMMGGGAMGPPIILRIMFALVDSDGDGTISLQEFQVAHERIFKAMDSNKDGKLTLEEMQAFMHGTRKPVPQP
jgi:EF hand